MNKSFAAAAPVLPEARNIAMFLDFDGTLVDFADHPDDVMLDPATKACLERINTRLDGALAIITGRDIAAVDLFLAPQTLPVAGVHGLVRRDAGGQVHDLPIDADLIARLTLTFEEFAAGHEGVLVERKPGAAALHFRQRPDLAGFCLQEVERLACGLEGITLIRGKAVIEARAGGADKGSAIEAFLKEPPFAGRCPLFAGDDVTDEDGFARVNARGGITIKVGAGPTRARYRVPAIADFRHWLCDTARRFEEQGTA